MLFRSSAGGLVKTILKIVVGCCLVLAFAFLSSPVQASANTTANMHAGASGPTLQVDVGFEATFKSEYWTPVYVVVSNGDANFAGTLSVSMFSGPPHSSTIGILSPWSFQQPVGFSKGAKKQYTIYVPYFLGTFSPTGVVAYLRDTRGKVVATQTSTSGYEVKPGNLFIGLLSDMDANFDPLRSVSLPNQTSSPTTSRLDATIMPTQATALENFDVIVLDDFSSSALSRAQLAALRTWVNQGGVLIEVGGQDWQRTLGALPPAMLPVVVNGMDVLPAGTHLLPTAGPVIQTAGQAALPDTLKDPVVASTARLRQPNGFFNSETLLSSGTMPLIVRAQQGQGVISYLAFDPTNAPLLNWQNTGALWKAVLLQTMGDAFLLPNSVPTSSSGPGQILTRGGVISMLAPAMLWGPWILAFLLISYLLILGPVRLYIVRRLKQPRWGWPVIVSSIVVFSLLAYGFAFYQRGAALSANSISFIQIDQGGSTAHVTTYMGIYVPGQGDYTLHIPGESLAQPVANQFLDNKGAVLASGDLSASMQTAAEGTDMKLPGLGPWTFHPLVFEQDRQLQGNLVTHLSLRGGHLVGTVSNTLNTSLSDVYILFSHTFVSVGDLAPGETRQIDFPLHATTSQPATSLADQIAANGGLTTPYVPYAHNDQSRTAFQSHMALLSALEGAGYSTAACGGSCSTHAITSRGMIYLTGGKVPNPNVVDMPDPLLVACAPVTLIAWANQPGVSGADEVTINGNHPSGQHENFLQMPLNIAISGSGKIPPGIIGSHLVDIQSYDAQAILPGIYTMNTGSLTFAFSMPTGSNQLVNGLTVTVPDLLAGAAGPSTNVSHLGAGLYNWQTGAWDTISLHKNSFTTGNSGVYIDPGGRVLLQVTNQNSAMGKLFFGTPLLATT
jgi:hypothetical protein